MRLSIQSVLCGLMVAVGATVATPVAAISPDSARAVLEQKADAVITLEVIQLIKFNWGGQQQEQERKLETIATVIDARGLAVTSLSNVDPSKMIEMYYDDDDAVTASIKSVRYILPDGTERDAALILRDPDLDLAFLRPLDVPEEPMNFVDFAGDHGTAAIFDSVFAVERAGRIARRSVLGKQGNIIGMIERPRLIYLPDGNLISRQLGAPVYTSGGELLGLTATYHFPGGKRALGDNDDPSIPVVLPASDIADVARQAPEDAAAYAFPSLDESEGMTQDGAEVDGEEAGDDEAAETE